MDQHQLIEVEARVEKGRRNPIDRLSAQERPETPYFTYDPLNTSQDVGTSIRLLTVQPTRPNEDPIAEMQAWPLHDTPDFEALSYCWGHYQPISFMRLNGKRFAITPSLHKALSHITADRTAPLTIWVDAICINQGDTNEKSQQVLLMRDIYERASRTVVWLGPSKGDTHLALTMCLRMLDLHGYTFFKDMIGENHYKVFDGAHGQPLQAADVIERRRQFFIRNLVKLWSDHGPNLSNQDIEGAAKDSVAADMSASTPRVGIPSWVGRFTDHVYATPSTPIMGQLSPQLRKSQLALRLAEKLAQKSTRDPDKPQLAEIIAARELFDSPWFNRVWVVQETIMAREVVFQYGTDSVPGWIMHAGLQVARDLAPELKISLLNFSTVWMFRRVLCRHSNHDHEKHKGKRDLMSLLKTFRTRDATNHHDKVYALLGITSDDCEKLGVTVQYGRSVAETYTEVAIAIIRSTGDLRLLNVLKPAVEPTPDLPSWVPDWADTTLPLEPLADIRDLTDKKVPESNHYRQAAASTEHSIQASISGSLTLSGYICDTIVGVGIVMPTFDTEANILEKGFQPCRPELMRGKLIQTQRMFTQVRDRFKIYEAWQRKVSAMGPYPTGEDPSVVYKCVLQAGPDKPSHVTTKDFEAWYENLGTYYDALERIIAYNVVSSHRSGYGVKTLEWAAAMHEYRALPMPPKFDCTYGRRLVQTTRGYLGLAPMSAEIGDSIVLTEGARVPLITRGKGEEWIMIGPAYVHGIMSGNVAIEGQCQVMTFV
jgi:hypothetical protein